MSEPQFTTKQKQQHADDPMFDGGTSMPGASTHDDALYAQAIELLKTRRDLDKIPLLVGNLDTRHRIEFRGQLDALAQVASGDIVLRTTEVLALDKVESLQLILAAKPKVSASKLHAFLGKIAQAEISDLEPIATALESFLGKAPFLDVFPSGVDALGGLSTSPTLVRWFVETTAPAIVAFGVSRLARDEDVAALARALDLDRTLWDHWLPAAHGAPGDRVWKKLAISQFPDINASLEALTKPRSGPTIESVVTTKTPTRQQLLEAVGIVDSSQAAQLVAAVRRVNPPADDILWLADSLSLGMEIAAELVVAAPDVTPAHIKALLFTLNSLPTKASTIQAVRKHAGNLRLSQVIAQNASIEHGAIVESPELRAWYLAGASPAELLWFCGTTPALSAKACRIVGATEGWQWTRQLTMADGRQELAVIALNCPDRSVGKYIHEHILGNNVATVTNVGAVASDPATHGGERTRLDAAVAAGANVITRLADMDPVERAQLGRDDVQVAALAGAVTADEFARAAYLLDLAFRSVVAHAPAPSRATVTYLATRPHDEQLAVLHDPALVAMARRTVEDDLLLVFPTLREPAVLAAALTAVPKLLEMLLDSSDPATVVQLVSADPVRKVTERILRGSPELVAKLPAFADLSTSRQADVDALDRDAHGRGRDALDAYQADETAHVAARVKESGSRLAAARQQATLAAALDQLLAGGGSEVELRGILEERRAEVPQLLGDVAHAAIVARLARRVELPPHLVFPWLGGDALFYAVNARHWYYQLSDTTLLLRIIATTDSVRPLVAKDLATPGAARTWLSLLPAATELSDLEDRGLDYLVRDVKDVASLRHLFNSRFGVEAPSSYDLTMIGKLYTTLARLPRAQLQQGRIHAIIERPIQGGSGMWDEDMIHLDTTLRDGRKTDEYYKHDSDEADWKPRAEFARLWGIDDTELDRKRDRGDVEIRFEKGVEQVRMATRAHDQFTSTVLHEVGHQVDEILGNRTEFIYGMAGWQEFADADFDTWASEMGGWERVAAPDKVQIREAWIDARRTGTSVASLVAPDHAALASKYAGVGIVDGASKGGMFLANGRAFRAWGRFFSLNADAYETRPTDYALRAPGEYFAESYTEYYRNVDGTAAGNAKRGGRLPSPVKQWFDKNVDTLRYDPQRFVEKSDGAAGAGPGTGGGEKKA